MRSAALRARILAASARRAPPLVLDGALGTELERRGVPTDLPLWSARALWEAPEAVRAIHREAVRAGAEALTANTFRTQRRTLDRGGRGARGRGAQRARRRARARSGCRRVAGRVRAGLDRAARGLLPPRSRAGGRRARARAHGARRAPRRSRRRRALDRDDEHGARGGGRRTRGARDRPALRLELRVRRRGAAPLGRAARRRARSGRRRPAPRGGGELPGARSARALSPGAGAQAAFRSASTRTSARPIPCAASRRATR